jgi:glucan 1,3-beta-glucosidase
MAAIQTVRMVSGQGEGNGPMISLHDGFLNTTAWEGYFPNADRVSLDYHPYVCFGPQLPVNFGNLDNFGSLPCTAWGAQMNISMGAFGLTTAGEFSNAVNDCGLFLNGVNEGARYDGTYGAGGSRPVGDCGPWNNWSGYNQATKNALMGFAKSNMDALQVSTYIVLSKTLVTCYPSRIGFSGLGRSETRLLPAQ